MQTLESVSLEDVQAVYAGVEGDLWELVMGEQIHIGGFTSSMDLAERAGIGAGMRGVDLCCCTGAGMRFLVRVRGVERMVGVDATERMVSRGRERAEAEGLAEEVSIVHADVVQSGIPGGEADFVWGEDAWCYVADKPRLLAEAVRICRPGGTIAFTDWVAGEVPMSDADWERYLSFMKFPSVFSLDDYRRELEHLGCSIESAEDTGRFAGYADLYLEMLGKQLTYDALKLIGWDTDLMQTLAGELSFIRDLAHAGMIAQGRVIARTA